MPAGGLPHTARGWAAGGHRSVGGHRSPTPQLGATLIPVVIALVFAASLFAFGCWGRRNAGRLVPTGFSKEGQDRKERQFRRNARIMQLTAGFLVLLVVVSAIVNLFRS